MVDRRGRKPCRWDDKQLKDLRKLSVADFCKKYGAAKSTVYKKRAEVGIVEVLREWTPEMDKLIGETDVSDASVMLKLPKSVIWERLRKLKKKPIKPKKEVKYTKPFLEKMLKKYTTQRRVAEKLGCSQQRISNLCRKYNIVTTTSRVPQKRM